MHSPWIFRLWFKGDQVLLCELVLTNSRLLSSASLRPLWSSLSRLSKFLNIRQTRRSPILNRKTNITGMIRSWSEVIKILKKKYHCFLVPWNAVLSCLYELSLTNIGFMILYKSLEWCHCLMLAHPSLIYNNRTNLSVWCPCILFTTKRYERFLDDVLTSGP